MIGKAYIGILIIFVVGLFAAALWKNGAFGTFPSKLSGEQVGCTMEAKLCPDGSAVGRVGPSCEFAACPSSVQATTTAALNQTITDGAIRLTPVSLLEDSRCPVDVVCIWAGQVRVSVRLDAEGEQKTLEITSGKPVVFAGRTVTLVATSPMPHSKSSIETAAYSFVFSVKALQ